MSYLSNKTDYHSITEIVMTDKMSKVVIRSVNRGGEDNTP